MDSNQVALKLFLDCLGIPIDTISIDNHSFAQPAIYLGQLSGVDLGYRFGWYYCAPACPDLSVDYFLMAEALAIGDDDTVPKQLIPEAKDRLIKLRSLMIPPDHLPVSQSRWLKTVATYHFLRTVSRLDEKKTLKLIRKSDPSLIPFLDDAKKALIEANILKEGDQ